MSTISVIEKLLANKSKNDFAAAVAAGISAGIVESFIHALYHDLGLLDCARRITLGIAAYLIIGILVQRFWRVQVVPGWILTALFGSILFLAALLAPGIIKGWYDPYRVQRSFMDYIFAELDAAGSGLDLLIFVNAPVIAAFHYAREIITALKEWHAGSEPTSVLHDE